MIKLISVFNQLIRPFIRPDRHARPSTSEIIRVCVACLAASRGNYTALERDGSKPAFVAYRRGTLGMMERPELNVSVLHSTEVDEVPCPTCNRSRSGGRFHVEVFRPA